VDGFLLIGKFDFDFFVK